MYLYFRASKDLCQVISYPQVIHILSIDIFFGYAKIKIDNFLGKCFRAITYKTLSA